MGDVTHTAKKCTIITAQDHDWEEGDYVFKYDPDTPHVSPNDLAEPDGLTSVIRNIIEKEFLIFKDTYIFNKRLKELKDNAIARARRAQEPNFNPFWWPEVDPQLLNQNFILFRGQGIAAQAYKASTDANYDLDRLR